MTTQLVTLAELKTYLNITSNDYNNVLTVAINVSSSAAESYCGRAFAAGSVTEYHDGGRPSIFVRKIPINNVTSLFEYSGSEYIKLIGPFSSSGELINTVANAVTVQFSFNSDTGQIMRSDGTLNNELDITSVETFSPYQNGVKITYNGGYDTIPDDLKMAVMDYAKMIYKQEQNSPSAVFQGESMQSWSLSANFPPHIRRIFDFYRII